MIGKIQKLLSNKRNKAVAYSFSSSFIARLAGLLSTIVITPLLVNYFSKETFALWSILILVVGFSGFADLGMGHSLMNHLSKAKYNNKKDQEKKLIATTAFFLFISSIFLGLVLFFLSQLVDWNSFFKMDNVSLSNQMTKASYLVIFIFFVNVPFSLVHKIQYAWLDNHIYHLWEIVQKVLTIVFLLMCVYLKLSLSYFVIAFYSPFLIVNALNLLLYSKKRKIISQLFFNGEFLNSLDYKIFRIVFNSGALFFLVALFFNLGRSVDSFIIGRYSSLEFVTNFEIIKKPFDLILVFIMMLSSGLWPAFGDAIHSKDYKWIESAVKKSLTVVSIVSFLGLCFLVIFGNDLLRLWLGGDYSFVLNLFIVVACWYFLLSINNVISSFLGAHNIIKKQILMFLSFMIIGIPLKIFGVQSYNILGLVVATIIVFLITILIPSLIITRNIINANIRK